MTRDEIERRVARRAAMLAAGADLPPPPMGSDGTLSRADVPRELRPAAVLVPLVDRPEGLTVLLTQRTDDMPSHAGQIAFPGGRRQPEDADLTATALREAEEEIGLAPAHVQIIGRLDSYVTGTGFEVTPVVGFVDPAFSVRPDPREVADVFEVPLSHFLDARNHQIHSRTWQGRERRYYAMPYGDRYIWGATAGMLKNLHFVLLESP
jgi:8-oxo-dGTP pyrophosphatase MutT (NUDIX family)